MLLDCLKVFVVAMLPVVELRGAIPCALALDIPLYIAFPIAILGNMFPVPFILLFFDKAKVWFRNFPVIGKIFAWVDKKAAAKAAGVKTFEFWAVVTFVAIPLPGTGAWTGALVAALLDIRLRNAIPAVFIGLLIAASITLAVTMGVIHLF